MPVIDHIDLTTRRIYLATDVREFHPVDDIYKEIRTLRRTDESLRGFDMPVMAYGNVPKGGGKFTPRYAMLRLGWKIVPENTSHILNVTGEMITDTGEPGTACFDLEPLSAESKVIIQYEPPAAEVIVPEVGEIPEGIALEQSVQAVKAKTDNLPADPVGMAALASAHGEGSWEGATPAQVWQHTDRRLTSRDVESEQPGEYLSSEEQVEAALKMLSDKLDELLAKVAKAGANFTV